MESEKRHATMTVPVSLLENDDFSLSVWKVVYAVYYISEMNFYFVFVPVKQPFSVVTMLFPMQFSNVDVSF